jgi:RHS repeat-associated protein
VAELNGTNGLVRSYLWGTDLSGSPLLGGAGGGSQGAGGVGGLLLVTSHASPVTRHFVSMDGNGNVTALVDATDGTVKATYDYGPFGELVRADGPMAKANPFRFSTKYQDDESDLVYYGYRYLANGRWLNRDPIEEAGGLNLYGFVGNDGVNGVDALGQYKSSIQSGQGLQVMAFLEQQAVRRAAAAALADMAIRGGMEAGSQMMDNAYDPCRRWWELDGNRLNDAMYNPYNIAMDAMLGPLIGKGIEKAASFVQNYIRTRSCVNTRD